MLSKLAIPLPSARICMVSQFAALLVALFLVHIQVESQAFASVFPHLDFFNFFKYSSFPFWISTVLCYCADFFDVPKAGRSEKALEGCPDC